MAALFIPPQRRGIDKSTPPPGPDMAPPQLTAAERLFRSAWKDEIAEVAHLDLANFRAAGRRATKANPNPTGEDAAWWQAEGPRMVQRWMDWRQSSQWRTWTTPDGEPAIELGIETEIAGMPLKMIIDRVMVIPRAETLCLVDLKTGSRKPESDLQLGIYRLGIMRQYGVTVDYGAYWMAREGRLSAIMDLKRYDERMLNSWFDQLRRAIENEVFPPHLTNMCRACGLNRYCAAWGGLESHLDPDSPDHQEIQ